MSFKVTSNKICVSESIWSTQQHEMPDQFLENIEASGDVTSDHDSSKAGERNRGGLRMTSISPSTATTPYTTKMKLSTPSFVWPKNQRRQVGDSARLASEGKVNFSMTWYDEILSSEFVNQLENGKFAHTVKSRFNVKIGDTIVC